MNAIIRKNSSGFFFFGSIFLLFLLLTVITGIYYFIIIPFLFLFFLFGWQNIRAVFFLLIALLPWSFEYNFSATLSTDIPDEFLMLFSTFLFFAYYFNKPDVLSSEVWKHPLMLLLAIHFIWIIVSVCFTTSGLISIKYLLAKSWYIGVFVLAPLLLLRNKMNFRITAIVFATSIMIIVLVVLIRHAINGFTFATVNYAVIPFFRNHVVYSAMLVCTVPILLAFYKPGNILKKKILLALSIAVLLVALYFSYSRGAWLALFAGLLTYLLIKKKLLFLVFITVLVAAFTSLFWVKSNDNYLSLAHDYKTTIYHQDFRQHLIATYKLKDVSTAERFYRWIAGVRMIKDNWLTGYGPGTFYYNYKPYAVSAFKTWVSKNEDRSTVHNYFLLIAIEQGIPGLLFFLLLLGAMLYYAQILYHRIRDDFYKKVSITAGAIISMLIVVNFLSDLIETDKIGSIFFLCLSALVIADLNTRNERSDSLSKQQTIS